MTLKQYINSIRNPAKRAYAIAFAAWVSTGNGFEPERGDLSVMGAQAVRLNVCEIIKLQSI